VNVDDVQQRPHEPVRVPRIVPLLAEQQLDQRVRIEEPDTGTHPVAAAHADTEPVVQTLRHPALDATGRHDHQLLRERVCQRRGEQLRQPVCEQVGVRSARWICNVTDARLS